MNEILKWEEFFFVVVLLTLRYCIININKFQNKIKL